MRILVVGAGAIGGYYGGRLIEAGRDVTFLVRPRRAAELAEFGLCIRSPHGDVDLGTPRHLLPEAIEAPYDLILFTPKAYDLDGAIASTAPAVGPRTMIMPLLNGMRHIDALVAAFGPAAVLGGLCAIPATLESPGVVRHLAPLHSLTYGERDGGRSPRTEAVAASFDGAGFDSLLSEHILLEMWEKWTLLASLAGLTCLMQTGVGDIMQAGGEPVALALLDECAAIAAAAGHTPRPDALARMRGVLTDPTAPTTASMLRDMRRGAPVEVEHVIADLLRRRPPEAAPPVSVLQIALVRLLVYERQRLAKAG
jgi:2-dehydropantoate 2-reductase